MINISSLAFIKFYLNGKSTINKNYKKRPFKKYISFKKVEIG